MTKMNFFKNKDVELVSKMGYKLITNKNEDNPFYFMFDNYSMVAGEKINVYDPNELDYVVDTSHTDDSWLRMFLFEKIKPEPIVPKQQIVCEFDGFDPRSPKFEASQLIQIIKKHNEDNFLNNLQFVPNPPVNVIRDGVRIIKLNVWKEEAILSFLPRIDFRLPNYS